MFAYAPGSSGVVKKPRDFTVSPEWASESLGNGRANDSKAWHHLQPIGKDAQEVILMPAMPPRSCNSSSQVKSVKCSKLGSGKK